MLHLIVQHCAIITPWVLGRLSFWWTADHLGQQVTVDSANRQLNNHRSLCVYHWLLMGSLHLCQITVVCVGNIFTTSNNWCEILLTVMTMCSCLFQTQKAAILQSISIFIFGVCKHVCMLLEIKTILLVEPINTQLLFLTNDTRSLPIQYHIVTVLLRKLSFFFKLFNLNTKN